MNTDAGTTDSCYWLVLFTHATWQTFLANGATVVGFREQRWLTVKQIKPGDQLLCYLTGVSRWIGISGGRPSDVAYTRIRSLLIRIYGCIHILIYSLIMYKKA